MKVALDATPLLGPRTGVGQYVDHLVRALVAVPERPELVLAPFTLRGGRRPDGLPAGIRWRHRPLPARGLHGAWRRSGWPPAEWLTGRIDVFHATNYVAPPSRRARTVITVHDLSFVKHPETVTRDVATYRELVPQGLRRAALVLTPSESVATEVRDHYGVPADRVVATPLGVDPTWAASPGLGPEDRAGLDLPERFLLFVGARQPRKDLPTLLRAHAALSSVAPDTPPLVLVGPPGWGEEVDTRGSAVLVRQHVPRPVLQRLVTSAAAVVMPSLYEGFGLPVLEAMAAGTPVIASDIPAHREVGADTIRYFAPRSSDELAEQIGELARTGPSHPQLARARTRAASFTWARCARATAGAYQRSLA